MLLFIWIWFNNNIVNLICHVSELLNLGCNKSLLHFSLLGVCNKILVTPTHSLTFSLGIEWKLNTFFFLFSWYSTGAPEWGGKTRKKKISRKRRLSVRHVFLFFIRHSLSDHGHNNIYSGIKQLQRLHGCIYYNIY